MSVLPARWARAATSALSRASRFAISAMPSFSRSRRLLSSVAVANTVAPSRAKATAQARPVPTAAAVTNARLPFRRSDMFFPCLLFFRHCEEQSDEAIHVSAEGLDCFAEFIIGRAYARPGG